MHRPEGVICLAVLKEQHGGQWGWNREGRGAGTASLREGRDEIRDHTAHADHRENLAFILRGATGAFREEEGHSLTCVLTASLYCNGDTVAWRGAGLAWGHSADAQFSSQARHSAGQVCLGEQSAARVG